VRCHSPYGNCRTQARNRSAEAIVVQEPEEVNGHETPGTVDNRNIQNAERRQLRNLCRNCASQLIVGQAPAEARESEWARNTTRDNDNRNIQLVERRQLRYLCRNCASQLIVMQVPAKKHVNGHETRNNRNIQIGERRQLRNLCRNFASQLIVLQKPAKKHVNLNGQQNTISDILNVQLGERRRLRNLCRNCPSQLIVVQAPAKKQVNLVDTEHYQDNLNVQIGKLCQLPLPNLCRNRASQLIVVQAPATKHMNLNGYETPPVTITTYKTWSAVNCTTCVGIVPDNWLL
jgi:hypothetical protein